MQHLAVFKNNALDLIFSGKKKTESRFSLSKIPPYGTIFEGDEVFLKESGGKVLGRMRAGKIRSFYRLTPEKIKKIEKEFNESIQAGKEYWQEKKESRYGTLIEITEIEKFKTPFEIKKHDRRPWITLKETEVPLDKSQIKIRFGGSDSLSALKGLIEKYISYKKESFKGPFLKIIKTLPHFEIIFRENKKISIKEKEALEEALAEILIAILTLSSKLDVDLYEKALKELSRKKKYSIEELRNLK